MKQKCDVSPFYLIKQSSTWLNFSETIYLENVTHVKLNCSTQKTNFEKIIILDKRLIITSKAIRAEQHGTQNEVLHNRNLTK